MSEEYFERNHHARKFYSRHFEATVEVYCSVVDEVKVLLGEKYVRHCPMCGDELGEIHDG